MIFIYCTCEVDYRILFYVTFNAVTKICLFAYLLYNCIENFVGAYPLSRKNIILFWTEETEKKNRDRLYHDLILD